MQLTKRNAESVVQKVCAEHVACTHHVRGFVVVGGKRLFAVHCSFGRGEMPKSIINRFRKSLYLEPDEFRVLAACRLSREQYLDLLKDKGVY